MSIGFTPEEIDELKEKEPPIDVDFPDQPKKPGEKKGWDDVEEWKLKTEEIITLGALRLRMIDLLEMAENGEVYHILDDYDDPLKRERVESTINYLMGFINNSSPENYLLHDSLNLALLKALEDLRALDMLILNKDKKPLTAEIQARLSVWGINYKTDVDKLRDLSNFVRRVIFRSVLEVIRFEGEKIEESVALYLSQDSLKEVLERGLDFFNYISTIPKWFTKLILRTANYSKLAEVPLLDIRNFDSYGIDIQRLVEKYIADLQMGKLS